LTAPFSRGQTTFATLTGNVVDPVGAAVPGATVEAIHTASNYLYSTKTNDLGLYTLPQLREGEYSLHVRASGFKEHVTRDVTLAAQDALRIDVGLEIGAMETAVEVTAGATLIQTESARLSNVTATEAFHSLPINSRAFIDYAMQTPGLVSDGGGLFRISGSKTYQNNAASDGANIGVPRSGDAYENPQGILVESLQEMRIDVANNSAEFGMVGQITLITKSGSNQFHGSLFDYYTSSGLSARNPFALSGTASITHDLGVSASGPVIIPKLFMGATRRSSMLSMKTTGVAPSGRF